MNSYRKCLRHPFEDLNRVCVDDNCSQGRLCCHRCIKQDHDDHRFFNMNVFLHELQRKTKTTDMGHLKKLQQLRTQTCREFSRLRSAILTLLSDCQDHILESPNHKGFEPFAELECSDIHLEQLHQMVFTNCCQIEDAQAAVTQSAKLYSRLLHLSDRGMSQKVKAMDRQVLMVEKERRIIMETHDKLKAIVADMARMLQERQPLPQLQTKVLSETKTTRLSEQIQPPLRKRKKAEQAYEQEKKGESEDLFRNASTPTSALAWELSLCHPNITLRDSVATKTQLSGLCSVAMTNTLPYSSFAFKMKQCSQTILIGICISNLIQSTKLTLKNMSQPGHGFYGIDGSGYTYHHEYNQQNNTYKGFKLLSGDTVSVDFDATTGKFIMRKGQKSASFQISRYVVGQQLLRPCVAMFRKGDSVEILSRFPMEKHNKIVDVIQIDY